MRGAHVGAPFEAIPRKMVYGKSVTVMPSRCWVIKLRTTALTENERTVAIKVVALLLLDTVLYSPVGR